MNQCTLERGTTRTTSWIPTKYAIKGKFLEMKNDQGKWIDGWRVVSVSNPPSLASYILERSEDYKHTRKSSDAVRGHDGHWKTMK